MSAPAGPDHGSSELLPGISVVVPVFKSQESLPELIDRVLPVLATFGSEHEVILVDDGSADGSWSVVKHLAQYNPHVLGFRLMRNFGQHNALLLGIRSARYDVVVTMDDDLQNPPEEIPKLIAALNDGCDVVYGTPATPASGLWRKLGGQLTRVALRQATGGNRTVHDISSFRAFRTSLREAFAMYQSSYASIDILLAWGTTRFSSVPVRQDPRQHGTSTYAFGTLVTHGLNMLTGFSTRPLQLASLLGFSFTVFGFAGLAYVLIHYLMQGESAPESPLIVSIIALFSGVQLLTLGVIGEYLSRVYVRSLDRPTYVVAETTADLPMNNLSPLNDAETHGNASP